MYTVLSFPRGEVVHKFDLTGADVMHVSPDSKLLVIAQPVQLEIHSLKNTGGDAYQTIATLRTSRHISGLCFNSLTSHLAVSDLSGGCKVYELSEDIREGRIGASMIMHSWQAAANSDISECYSFTTPETISFGKPTHAQLWSVRFFTTAIGQELLLTQSDKCVYILDIYQHHEQEILLPRSDINSLSGADISTTGKWLCLGTQAWYNIKPGKLYLYEGSRIQSLSDLCIQSFQIRLKLLLHRHQSSRKRLRSQTAIEDLSDFATESYFDQQADKEREGEREKDKSLRYDFRFLRIMRMEEDQAIARRQRLGRTSRLLDDSDSDEEDKDEDKAKDEEERRDKLQWFEDAEKAVRYLVANIPTTMGLLDQIFLPFGSWKRYLAQLNSEGSAASSPSSSPTRLL